MGEGGYGYIVTHTNDVLVAAVNPTSIFNKLKETYIFKILARQKFILAVTTHSLGRGVLLGELLAALPILCKLLGISEHFLRL